MHTLRDPRKAETYCDRQYDLATRNGEAASGPMSRSGSSAFRPSERLPRSLSMTQGTCCFVDLLAAHCIMMDGWMDRRVYNSRLCAL